MNIHLLTFISLLTIYSVAAEPLPGPQNPHFPRKQLQKKIYKLQKDGVEERFSRINRLESVSFLIVPLGVIAGFCLYLKSNGVKW